jgi:hypothetical protein
MLVHSHDVLTIQIHDRIRIQSLINQIFVFGSDVHVAGMMGGGVGEKVIDAGAHPARHQSRAPNALLALTVIFLGLAFMVLKGPVHAVAGSEVMPSRPASLT